MLDHPDIGISTGAYAELPLAAALARIAELAPAAEIFSYLKAIGEAEEGKSEI